MKRVARLVSVSPIIFQRQPENFTIPSVRDRCILLCWIAAKTNPVRTSNIPAWRSLMLTGTEQQEWLKKEIQKEEFKSAPYKMVVIHIPPVGSDWHGPLDILRKILPVLKNQNITAMICGHTHRYQYIEPQPEEFDFPIIINAHTTSLEVDATSKKMTAVRKDTERKVLNQFNF
jgi:hypothetical protein